MVPRVALSQEQKMEYKLKDFKKWVKSKMAETGKTQEDVAKALGVSQGRVSQMLKDPEKRNKENRRLTYKNVLLLCDFLGAETSDKERFLTL